MVLPRAVDPGLRIDAARATADVADAHDFKTDGTRIGKNPESRFCCRRLLSPNITIQNARGNRFLFSARPHKSLLKRRIPDCDSKQRFLAVLRTCSTQRDQQGDQHNADL